MSSVKLIVVFAILFLAIAVAYPDADEEVDRKGGHGHHGGGGGHYHRGGHGHHGGRGHHHHHGLTFFKDLNDTVQQQFIEIWRDDDLSRDEKKAKVNELAETVLTADQLAEFRQNQAEREQRKQEKKAEMDAKIAALSPNARAAAERIRAIWHDETQSGPDSWKLKKQKIAEIKAGLSDSENEELDGLWGRKHGQRGECMLKRLSFYKDLEEATKAKFRAIAQNNDLTREEKKEQAKQLAQEEFTPEQLSEYERVAAEYEQYKKEKQAERDAKIAAMSPNARAAAEQMRAIMENESLDWDEKKTQVRAIKEDLSDDEKAELDSLWEGGHHHRGRFSRHKLAKLRKVKAEAEANDDDDE